MRFVMCKTQCEHTSLRHPLVSTVTYQASLKQLCHSISLYTKTIASSIVVIGMGKPFALGLLRFY